MALPAGHACLQRDPSPVVAELLGQLQVQRRTLNAALGGLNRDVTEVNERLYRLAFPRRKPPKPLPGEDHHD